MKSTSSSQKNFLPLSLVDWDGDFNLDYLGTDSKHATLTLLTWSGGNVQAVALPTMADLGFPNGTRIEGLVSYDFNRDGRNDVLVTHTHGAVTAISYLQRCPDSAGCLKRIYEVVAPLASPSSPVALVNYYGNCAGIDLIGVFTSSPSRYSALPNQSPVDSSCVGIGNIEYGVIGVMSESPIPTTSPPFVMTVDLDSDGGADVVYASAHADGVTTYVARRAPNMLRIYDAATVPNNSGMPNFEDLDADGHVDLAVPVCYPFTAVACQGSYDKVNHTHVLILLGSGSGVFPHVVPKSDVLPPNAILVELPHPMAPNSLISHTSPQTVHFGDFDSDMFPDLMYVDGTNTMHVLASPGGDLTGTWKSRFDFGEGNVIKVGWIVSQNGRVDIVACTTPHRQCHYISNGISIDGLFATAIVLNGARDTVDYGTTQIGAVHRFWFMDVRQRVIHRIATQSSTVQYGVLASPYPFFGLGRTYSYIEEYDVGIVTKHNEIASKSWQALIPNSFILVTPHPLTDTSKWQLLLYVAPSWLLIVAIGVAVLLVLLALPIGYLKLAEHREDRKERKKNVEFTGMIF
eukprot:PhM_4_TR10798/c0_g2_i1/m.48928/K17257/ITFG1; integrin alpha FG-GAP repeat containing protein 1